MIGFLPIKFKAGFNLEIGINQNAKIDLKLFNFSKSGIEFNAVAPILNLFLLPWILITRYYNFQEQKLHYLLFILFISLIYLFLCLNVLTKVLAFSASARFAVCPLIATLPVTVHWLVYLKKTH